MPAVVLSLVTGTPVRVDDLCTSCWCAALWDVPLFSLSNSGVSSVGTVRVCGDCHIRGS